MYIVPISTSITPLDILSQNESAAPVIGSYEKSPSFSDVFREVITDVTETQQVVNEDSARLVMGEIDDLHTIYNNLTKAEIAVETFVAVKDACQQSYNEIMQMSM
ncbi:MAG: flagellar hook-basal body complex protein FliE [Oscillospiraceae bacterium]|nr:flagellar hook-basal body complex protein FliE [Oscillospiraceae bacterium]